MNERTPLIPGDNCNRAYITELLKPFFEVKHIFISTQQKGRAAPPLTLYARPNNPINTPYTPPRRPLYIPYTPRYTPDTPPIHLLINYFSVLP